ncbi:UDP-N-acetyl glucosamine 2-epimerase [Wenzhouxiangella sp. XN201]|uniref:UDP-N-acetylglucosamine 2-epimerase n=1 Tax=Wenzhouxiangella sp. XN201 TaxID=2710755 RepID=UPI0013C8354E|nr:UDP-N-acetylglucosamine 2-epimerase [Wenzhouxiangella sp. XN201]NEZ03429.1 UDP-N-acetyl glucosamine 2-epimerase [Wenzhouxiangella sp. XN201]
MSVSPCQKPRIVAILGTRAQVIKMAPLLASFEHRHIPYRLLMTGQHQETIDELLDEFGITTPREALYEGREIKGIAQATFWLVRTAWRLWRRRASWAPSPRKHTVVLAHGDTFTTLLAAFVGRITGTTVAHVESGLRSFNWRHPFPEEITRLLVLGVADIAYCPGTWACRNINRRRVVIVDTQANTILDALRIALDRPHTARSDSDIPYAVVSVHRFENLYSRERMRVILDTVDRLAQRLNVVFVLHPTTKKRLSELNSLEDLQRNPNIELHSRMTYVPFMQLIAHSRLVITDGGSNQEELSYLGIPTLLMRMATERQEGLDSNVVLSRFDPECITRAVETVDTDPSRQTIKLPPQYPVDIIVDDLLTRLPESKLQGAQRGEG